MPKDETTKPQKALDADFAIDDADDDEIVDLLEVVKPGKATAKKAAGPDDADFSADLDAMLENLSSAEQATGGPGAPQHFPDPTPVDHKVDPDEQLDMPNMDDLDSLLKTLGAPSGGSSSAEADDLDLGDFGSDMPDLDAVPVTTKPKASSAASAAPVVDDDDFAALLAGAPASPAKAAAPKADEDFSVDDLEAELAADLGDLGGLQDMDTSGKADKAVPLDDDLFAELGLDKEIPAAKPQAAAPAADDLDDELALLLGGGAASSPAQSAAEDTSDILFDLELDNAPEVPMDLDDLPIMAAEPAPEAAPKAAKAAKAPAKAAAKAKPEPAVVDPASLVSEEEAMALTSEASLEDLGLDLGLDDLGLDTATAEAPAEKAEEVSLDDLELDLGLDDLGLDTAAAETPAEKAEEVSLDDLGLDLGLDDLGLDTAAAETPAEKAEEVSLDDLGLDLGLDDLGLDTAAAEAPAEKAEEVSLDDLGLDLGLDDLGLDTAAAEAPAEKVEEVSLDDLGLDLGLDDLGLDTAAAETPAAVDAEIDVLGMEDLGIEPAAEAALIDTAGTPADDEDVSLFIDEESADLPIGMDDAASATAMPEDDLAAMLEADTQIEQDDAALDAALDATLEAGPEAVAETPAIEGLDDFGADAAGEAPVATEPGLMEQEEVSAPVPTQSQIDADDDEAAAITGSPRYEEVDLNELDALLDDMLASAPASGPVSPMEQFTPARAAEPAPAAQAVPGMDADSVLAEMASLRNTIYTIKEEVQEAMAIMQSIADDDDAAPAPAPVAELEDTLAIQNMLDSQAVKLSSQNAKLEDLELTLADHTAKRQDLEQMFAEQSAKMQAMEQEFAKQAARTQDLEQLLAGQGDRNSELEQQLADMSANLDKLAAEAAAKVIREELAVLLQTM